MTISNNYHLFTEKRDKKVVNTFITDCLRFLNTYGYIFLLSKI